jgi:2-methylcitrate dehydratase PrpD
MRTIAEPIELKAAPPTGYAARFSGPFTFAAALSGGGGLGVFLEDFTDERVADPTLLQLTSKVTVVESSRCNDIFPNELPAIIDLTAASGERHVIEVLANRGGPGNPLSDDELEIKFRACAEPVVPADQLDRLSHALDNLEALPCIGALARLCSDTDDQTRLMHGADL